MMRVIAIAATVVICAACTGHDQQSGGVGAPKATPAGIVDKLNKEPSQAGLQHIQLAEMGQRISGRRV
jgi:hypothetical protein